MQQPHIPCFVISLARAVERRARIAKDLDELGIDFEFIDAVDATQGLSAHHESLIHRDPHYPMSEGEYGCALSHAGIYKSMVDAEMPHALILEDDAIPLQGLRTFLNKRCYLLRPMFLLYHNAAYVRWRGTTTLFDSTKARSLSMSCSHTVGYTIALEAARALHQATTPVRFKADWPMDIATLSACITQPVLIQHPPDRTHSFIEKERAHRPPALRRYTTAEYYVRKWRRLCSQRVRSSRYKTLTDQS